MNIYKQAAQLKLRIPTSVGHLTVEQLFDLPLIGKALNLTDIAIAIHSILPKSIVSDDLAFLTGTVPTNAEGQLAFDIIKDVIETKQAQAAAQSTAKARETQLKELQNILSEKKGEAKKEMSMEDLEAEIARLQNNL